MDNGWNDGCFNIFSSGITIFAIVAMIIISIAGVSSMGIGGIFAGPVVVGIGWIILSVIYS